MDGDAYRDMTHSEMQQMIWRKVAAFADYCNVEQRLDNGKIADVFYQVGQVTVIVEVKTLLKESLIENAYHKYADQCNYLAVACPPQMVSHDISEQWSGWRDHRYNSVGIWWVQWQGLTEIRPACRLRVKTPGLIMLMSPASSPFTVIGSPPCTAEEP